MGGPADDRALAYLAHERLGASFGTAYDISTMFSLITVLFNADVDAQGGAYATGVLVLMTSAALAAAIHAVRRASGAAPSVPASARPRRLMATLSAPA
jgi:hypothetical protein